MTGVRSAAIEAPAKVNLFLRVGVRRADGYHELETLFQSLELSDTLRVTLDPGADRKVALEVDGPDLGPPADNLAVRAAEAFLDEFGMSGAVRIELEKRIPAGGGLGGGSSDAAAVLRLLASLSWPGQAPDGMGRLLHDVAAALGSDVPFFLRRTPLALGRGRGEVLDDLAPLPRRDMVVALPPVHVSTPDAYRALARGREGQAREAGIGGAPRETDARRLAPTDWRPEWSGVEAAAHNDFEAVVVPAHGAIAASLDAMRQAGATTVLLSGSGAASFGLFEGAAEARDVAAALTRELGWSFLATATRTEVPEPVAG